MDAQPKVPRSEAGNRAKSLAFLIIGFAMLFLAANAFATAYVSAERYIHYWDYSLYWKKFGSFGQLLATNPATAGTYAIWSVANEDYTILPILPLLPFEAIFGAGRLSYILAVANVAVVPSAALMALVAERAMPSRSWPRYLLCASIVLCLHPLWVPALHGFPDAFGLIIACSVLLAYFAKAPENQSPLRLAGIGLLLCLMFLTRRWYIFWVASFFPAALLAYLLSSPRAVITWKCFWARGKALAIIGATCLVLLVVLAQPLVERMIFQDYSSAYAAYRSDLAAGGKFGQVVVQFGLVLCLASVAGLAWLVRRPESRQLGILLIVQAALSLGLFTSVQGFLGEQHFYLLVPAVGIGIAAATAAAWESRLNPVGRWALIGSVAAAVIVSSTVVFAPTRIFASPLLPQVRHPPLVRSDLPEIDRLLDVLSAAKPASIYVAASSEILNWDTLQVRCQIRHRDLCPRLETTADIDARDGFPHAILDADYVVLATPTQYHVRPEDQQVVGLIARDIRERRGIGASFEALPHQFTLMRGVRVQVFRRLAPTRDDDARALGDELTRSYPDLKSLFDYEPKRQR